MSPVSTGGRARQRVLHELRNRPQRGDTERLPPRPSARRTKRMPSRLTCGRAAARVAGEAQLLVGVQAGRGKAEHVGRDLLQRVRREPLDERVQPAVALEDEEGVVVPAVLADEAGPRGGGSRGKRRGDSLVNTRSPIRRVSPSGVTASPKSSTSSTTSRPLAPRAQSQPLRRVAAREVQRSRPLVEIRPRLTRHVAARERPRPGRLDRDRRLRLRQRPGLAAGEQEPQRVPGDAVGHAHWRSPGWRRPPPRASRRAAPASDVAKP